MYQMNMLKASFVPTGPVPIRWYTMGCIVLLLLGLIGSSYFGGVSIATSLILCVAWWPAFLYFADPEGNEWVSHEGLDQDSTVNSVFGSEYGEEFRGAPTRRGLPTDDLGIDELGGVLGTDSLRNRY